MSVEAATYISQLDPTLPTGSDFKSEGDDHLRKIKSCSVTTFPNLTAPVTVTAAQLNDVVNKALRAGDTYTGTHNFTGATITVPTKTAGTATTDAASTAFVQAAITAAGAAAADLTVNVVTDANVQALVGGMYVLTRAGAQTLATPVSPTPGQRFGVMVGNGRTDNVVAYAADRIGSLTESCTLNSAKPVGIVFRYINSTIGWAVSQ